MIYLKIGLVVSAVLFNCLIVGIVTKPLMDRLIDYIWVKPKMSNSEWAEYKRKR